MNAQEFTAHLEAHIQATLARLDTIRENGDVACDAAEVVRRLRLALRQEMEACEIAALWLPGTDEPDLKLALARLCGDEARHYGLILRRLAELGDPMVGYDPFAQGPPGGAAGGARGRSKLYEFFAALTDPVERVAAASFTREAIGYLRNVQFIAFCEQAGDLETARMYRDDIQPDEKFHVDHGRELLLRHATAPDSQARAQAACDRTLAMAEGVLLTLVQQHMSCAPGC